MVTEDHVNACLAAAGFEADELPGRRALWHRAAAAFARHTGEAPTWGWFVPGRIEVFGKHTDYAGGHSLVAAVPRGFAIAARPRPDGVVSVVDARWRDAVDIDPSDAGRVFKGWTNYAAVVARRLAANFPGAPLGADIVIASDLPRAAGLSSSSALVVGLSLALVRRSGVDARPEWRAAIQTRHDLAGYLGAVENGLAFGPLADVHGVGTHGGSEDHNAILNARASHVSAYGYLPVRHVGDARIPDDWRFVILTSGVHADKAGRVRGQYNRASLATRALVDLWQAAQEPAASGWTLAGVVADPDRLAALRNLAGRGHGDFSGDELRMRLAHFVGEDARVGAALEGFRAADMVQLSQLAAESQRDADRWLGNQVEETRKLAALASGAGAFAASSFGAGFGGAVWALARRADAADVLDRWRRAYVKAMPGVEVEGFVTAPGPGAVDLRPPAAPAGDEHVE